MSAASLLTDPNAWAALVTLTAATAAAAAGRRDRLNRRGC